MNDFIAPKQETIWKRGDRLGDRLIVSRVYVKDDLILNNFKMLSKWGVVKFFQIIWYKNF